MSLVAEEGAAAVAAPVPSGGTSRRPGEARIKKDYLVTVAVVDRDAGAADKIEDAAAATATAAEDGSAEAPTQKEDKKKFKGQNKPKERNRTLVRDAVRLCNFAAQGEECARVNCRMSHDLEEYMAQKEPDLGSSCPLFDASGFCPMGLRCRFSSAHTDADGRKQITIEEKKVIYTPVLNVLSKSTQNDLRKKNFSRSEKAVEYIKFWRQTRPDYEKCDGDIATLVENGRTPSGRREKQARRLNFHGKTYLAPLTTVGNLPFRRLCKVYGVDVTCGEMAHSHSLAMGSLTEWALFKRHPSEDIFGVQIAGSKTEQIVTTCDLINNECKVDFVDLNLGCPIESVFGNGCGSALLDRPGKIREALMSMDAVLSCPITAKIRTGVQMSKNVAHKLLPIIQDAGACMTTLHGRSRQQRYKHLADWNYIAECAKNKGDMQLFGNGDVLSHEDYYSHLEKIPELDGLMIARGALIKPWIFTEIKERRVWDISSRERLDMLKNFVKFGLEHWGSDTQGVNTTRRFLLEFQNFHYRYIPAGVLEYLPQKINERPPRYRGRDELETLLASPFAGDWIKISEMLLGPAPEGFHFIPKHRANSYEDTDRPSVNINLST